MFHILNPTSPSLPIPSLWVIPAHPPQVSSIIHRTWTGNSFPIWYYTCFNAILPNHSTLSLSHRVQKTVLYICVSFAVSKYSLFNKEIEMPLNFSYTPYSHIHAPQPRRHHSPDNVVPLCCCLVTKLCPTLCDPVDSSMTVSSVLHYHVKFAQNHVHAI